MSSKDSNKNNTFKDLALNNVKKGIKDYIIYFLTLAFGVALLYTFNTIDDNLQLLSGNRFLDSSLGMARVITAIFSIIICIIFGFLVTYANAFLMKRRKREFGIYITLGMNKKAINKLMFKETLIIGIYSLIAGLLLGILASQGISIITFKILGLAASSFKFSISLMASIKTIIFFGITLMLVNKFNQKNISKYKLIDLIHSDKKNEVIFIENDLKRIMIFFLSIVLMVLSYFILVQINISAFIVILCIILITLGTYLFFISISDFVINRIKKCKKIYYNDLNLFIVNQISSRIKSMSSSITVICLLLFTSMVIIPLGISLSDYIIHDLNKTTPYDATIIRYDVSYDLNNITESPALDSKYKSFKKSLEENNPSLNNIVSSINEIKEYSLPNITITGFSGDNSKDFNEALKNNIIGVTDYNNARVQQGLDPISLSNNEFAINCNIDTYKDTYKQYIDNNTGTVTINGATLNISALYDISYSSTVILQDNGTLIVPDAILSNLKPVRSILNINYIESTNYYDNMFLDAYYNLEDNNLGYSLTLKLSVDGEKISFNTIFSFIAIYLGIILLVSAGAILALQQLSETTTIKERFTLLKRLGVKEKQLNRAVFIQVLISFLLPLSLAIIHSIFMCGVFNNVISELAESGILKNILITLIIVISIYGTYFILSLTESLNIIREKKHP